MYKGLEKPEALLDPANADALTIATQGYGVGNWYFVTGDRATRPGDLREGRRRPALVGLRLHRRGSRPAADEVTGQAIICRSGCSTSRTVRAPRRRCGTLTRRCRCCRGYRGQGCIRRAGRRPVAVRNLLRGGGVRRHPHRPRGDRRHHRLPPCSPTSSSSRHADRCGSTTVRMSSGRAFSCSPAWSSRLWRSAFAIPGCAFAARRNPRSSRRATCKPSASGCAI